DGCGLLLKTPEAFLRAVGAEAGFDLAARFAAGPVFLNRDAAKQASAKAVLDREIERQGLTVAGWRVVPTDPSACGEEALRTLPHIEQVFVNAPDGMELAEFNRKL